MKKNIIYPTFILFAIAVIVSFMLALTNSVTHPIIKAYEEEKNELSKTQSLPLATGFVELDISDAQREKYSVVFIDKAENNVGYVVSTAEYGYKSKIQVVVGIDDNDSIINLSVVQQEETPGLGSKITQENYLGQFEGDLQPEVDVISGATISSEAVERAVDKALGLYKEVVRGESNEKN